MFVNPYKTILSISISRHLVFKITTYLLYNNNCNKLYVSDVVDKPIIVILRCPGLNFTLFTENCNIVELIVSAHC